MPRRREIRVELFINFTLLALLAVTALGVLHVTNLFAAVMLAGIYSFLSAGLFTVMDAVDVAFTEAAVGAGISTVLMLATLALVGSKVTTPEFRIESISVKGRSRRPLLPIVVVVFTGGILAYGTLDMPGYGDPDNPVHQHVAPHYLEESGHEIGIPNVVTSVLASYRGYDTMGETTVVFTAAVGVMILLSALRRRDSYGEEAWGDEVIDDMDVGFKDAFGETMDPGLAGPEREGPEGGAG
jgi:multicomponent Na+:H+ antiporter subunit B